MSEESRDFTLGAILTVTTGRLFCDMGGVYEILNYMTGDNLYTHQLPRAGDECKGPLLEQLPQLRDVIVPDEFLGANQVHEWVAQLEAVYGAALPVAPLAPGVHERRDPVAELDQMAGNRPVIVVHAEDLEP